MSDLDNILDEGEELSTPVAQEPVTPEQPRNDEGKFTPKGNDDGAMPAPNESKTVPIGSYQAEKQKRQEWESRYNQDIETLRKELESLKAPKEPPAPPPSIWEDEQGTFQHYGQQFTQTAVEQAAYVARLQTSELLMSQADPEFEAAKQDVFQFVGSNPAINAEVQKSPHPWQTAFKAFKNHQAMQQLGATDLSEIEAKMREKIMAELQAQPPAQPNIPRSLADAQSARASAQSAPGNPLSLQDILGG